MKHELSKYTNILKLQKKKIVNLEGQIQKIKTLKSEENVNSINNTAHARNLSTSSKNKAEKRETSKEIKISKLITREKLCLEAYK